MKYKSIEKNASQLAKDLSERNLFNLEEIKVLISVRFQDFLNEIIKEYSNVAEEEYYRLLQEQAKNRIGSKEYISLGYKLSAAKHKKAQANRIVNELRREDKYEGLKEYVIANFGKDHVDKFVNEFESKNNFPIISSSFS